MLNIAVAEDKTDERNEIVQILNKILFLSNKQYNIFEFCSGKQLLASITDYNIYFLDIQMEGISGIEAAKQIRTKNKRAIIIFITGLKDYVFDAFDVGAFHYILKPFDTEKLKKIVNAALLQFEDTDKFIVARTIRQSFRIYLNDIMYIESEHRKIKIHTNYDVIEYYYKLADIEKELRDNTFFRCHKSFIVNLKYVRSYDNTFIELKNSEKIYVSKYKLSDFSKAYMYYLKDEE